MKYSHESLQSDKRRFFRLYNMNLKMLGKELYQVAWKYQR